MSGASVTPDPRLAGVLVTLLVLAAVVGWSARLGTARAVLTAGVRAAAQLAAVSTVIVVVLHAWSTTTAFALLMFLVATVTSARRIGRHPSTAWAGLAIAAGVVGPLALILLSGVAPATPIAVVPIVGILIGGAMTATSLAGRHAVSALRTRFGEYEAALALGFGRRAAARLVCDTAGREALLPALDQTRTVGLVTLPGAFVGVLLGGGSPLQAGAVQLLVLVALLAVETLAAVVTVELVARDIIRTSTVDPASGRRRPRPRALRR
jgi:putative ABC transport system permease protein